MKKLYKSFFNFVFIGLLIAPIFFTSCFKKEDFNFGMIADQQSIDYDVALPLISTELSLGKILGTGDLVYADQEGLLHLVYTPSNNLNLNIGNLLKIPNQKIPPIQIQNVPYFKLDTLIRVSIQDTIPLSLIGNAMVDSIRMSSFALETAVRSKIGSILNYSIKIENLIDKFGQPLVLKDSIAKFSERGARFEYQNYMMNFPEISGKNESFIIMRVDFEMNMSQVSNEFPNIKYGDISISIDIKDMQFDAAYGYFGKLDFDIRDSIDFSLFSDLTINQLRFEEAYLKMNFSNGASLPCRIRESEIKAYFRNGSTSKVDLLPPNYDIPYPSPSDIPMLKKTEVVSNVKDLLTSIPSKFSFSFSGSMNPDDNRQVLNIISNGSTLEAKLDFDLPLNLSIDGYVLTDTFDFMDIQNVSFIKDFLLKINLENAFPVDVNLKLSFLGAKDTILFDFLDKGKIKGGSVTPDGRVNKPEFSLLQIHLNKDQIAKLEQIKKIVVCATLSTKDKASVKIFMDSDTQGYLGVKLGAKVTFSATSLLK